MAIRDITKYTRPRYIESPYSVGAYVGILKTPTLSIDTNNKLRLSWSNIDNNTNIYQLEYSYNSGDWMLYDSPNGDAVIYDLPNNLEDGTYKFRIRATATIYDHNTPHDFYSAWSNVTPEFTVSTINKISIETVAGGSQYYFGNIDPKLDYVLLSITKDNSSVNTIRYEKANLPSKYSPLTLDYDNPGSYVLSAVAYSNNEFLVHNNSASNTKEYNVIKLSSPVLLDDTFSKETPIVHWNAISEATGYRVYLNNKVINENFAGTTYDFTTSITPSVLNYSTKIVAIRPSSVLYPNPKYIESDISNEIRFGTLPTPSIALSTELGKDNHVILTNYGQFENAEEFEVYNTIGGKDNLLIRIPATENKYVLESLTPKTFNIKLKAISSSKNIVNSGFSNTVSYSFIKLSTPTIEITASDKNIIELSWNRIQNANYYDIYINYEKAATTVGNSYNVNIPIGNNVIYIIAKSNLNRFLDSDISNILRYHQDATSDYQLKINNVSYNMVLPFSFNETLDESMDTATAITTPIRQKEPFEAFSEVEIWVNSNYIDDDGTAVTKALPGFPKHMLLSQDDVKEVQLGNESLYQHNLNLIERTKLLETELSPDLSITQPMKYAIKSNLAEPNIIVPDYGTYNVFANNNKRVIAGVYGLLNSKINAIYNLDNSSIKNKLNNIYKVGSVVKLPYETATSFKILKVKGPSHVWLNSLDDYNIKLKRTYKYRKHNASYEPVAEAPETVIKTVFSNREVLWDTKDIPTGNYDIIMEIEISDTDWNTLKADLKYEGQGKLNFMYESGSIPTEIDPLNPQEYDFRKLKKYRLVWGSDTDGITLTNLDNSGLMKETKWESKNLYEAMKKVLTCLEPLEYGYISKYELDPRLSYLQEITCPELKFQGGKSLYEIFTIFGRLFYGIPRLGCLDDENIYHDNWITFDILDNTSIINLINTSFEDKNNIETMKSTIDNHSTGYISNLSNMISNEYYSTYPAGNIDDNGALWISTRSGANTDVVANKDNMAIVIDKPIYRLVSVFVKNFDKTQPNRYADIKDFVYEENIFQSLNNDGDGKGSAIYYKQGDNRILGLGNIPQASKSQAAFNIDPAEYIIQRIITFATGLPKSSQNDPNEFLYKVVYVPYVDARVYTEQSNIANLKNQTYKNLNQEDNIIFDKYFGKSAQTQIERLGNNSIEKNFRETNITKLPSLGQTKVFDGFTYYADDITYTFNNNYIDCTANFSKNFNKINERVGINAEYRLYRIYADDYVERQININKYCYLSFDKYDADISSISNTNYNLIENFKNSINDGTGKCSPHVKPDTFYIRNFKDSSSLLEYTDYNNITTNVPCSIISAAYNVFSNSIMLSGKFIDNYSAGIKASKTWNKQKVQQDVRYVDNNGENPIMGITLCNFDKNTIPVNPDNYPEAGYIATPNLLSNALFSEKIDLQKDNREAINIAYQLHLQTYDKNITIHRGLLNHLYYDPFKTDITEKINTPRYVFFKGDISKQDILSDNQYQKTDIISIERESSALVINSITINATEDYDGYALIYDSGEIAYSVKAPVKKGSFTINKMYLNFSDKKVNFHQN